MTVSSDIELMRRLVRADSIGELDVLIRWRLVVRISKIENSFPPFFLGTVSFMCFFDDARRESAFLSNMLLSGNRKFKRAKPLLNKAIRMT